MKNPFLVGKNIYLRGLTQLDCDGDYPLWLNDEFICQYSEHHVFPYTKEDAQAYISKLSLQKDKIMLAIIDKQTDKHIGNIAIFAISYLHLSAEFSVMIGNKEFLGKGYSKEASLMMLNHGFNTMNLHRIYCGTMQNNEPMKHLAISLGMIQEGVCRDEVYKNGKYHDTIRFSILKNEFNTVNKS
ncbi:MAG: GNAT family protein [Sulfurimonas sp.]|uniref:GNAT family N-acetyltransferase n=1 Tax=Sulfurimonas sp. TaxID=2022749 RepID=UPI002636EE7D|nr:GNAT family protein [Sulfurimonas sp.]MDD5400647.1 GNAT family protein [Sulfurimonas sp.]